MSRQCEPGHHSFAGAGLSCACGMLANSAWVSRDRLAQAEADLAAIKDKMYRDRLLVADADRKQAQRESALEADLAAALAEVAALREVIERIHALSLGAVSMFPPADLEISMICRSALARPERGSGVEG